MRDRTVSHTYRCSEDSCHICQALRDVKNSTQNTRTTSHLQQPQCPLGYRANSNFPATPSTTTPFPASYSTPALLRSGCPGSSSTRSDRTTWRRFLFCMSSGKPAFCPSFVWWSVAAAVRCRPLVGCGTPRRPRASTRELLYTEPDVRRCGSNPGPGRRLF